MALIKAVWKRTVRLREYEGETLELSVERNWDEVNDGDAVKAAVELDRELARAGDALVAERLSERLVPHASQDKPAARSPRPGGFGSQPEAPDPFVA